MNPARRNRGASGRNVAFADSAALSDGENCFSGFGVIASDSTASPHEQVPSAARRFELSEASWSECEWQDDLSSLGFA